MEYQIDKKMRLLYRYHLTNEHVTLPSNDLDDTREFLTCLRKWKPDKYTMAEWMHKVVRRYL